MTNKTFTDWDSYIDHLKNGGEDKELVDKFIATWEILVQTCPNLRKPGVWFEAEHYDYNIKYVHLSWNFEDLPDHCLTLDIFSNGYDWFLKTNEMLDGWESTDNPCTEFPKHILDYLKLWEDSN